MRAAEGRVVVAMAREDTGSAAVVERAVAREAAVMAEVMAVATAAARAVERTGRVSDLPVGSPMRVV